MIDMLKKWMKNNLLKKSYNSYQNSWFLVDKKDKEKYHLINIVMKMNEIIIYDVNLSFSIDEFSKKFVSIIIILLINFFSEYD